MGNWGDVSKIGNDFGIPYVAHEEENIIFDTLYLSIVLIRLIVPDTLLK